MLTLTLKEEARGTVHKVSALIFHIIPIVYF